MATRCAKPTEAQPDVASSNFPVDGGALDALDKWLSSPIFRLQLGMVVESLLSVPGCFFGMPSTLIVAPSFLALATEAASPRLTGALAVLVLTSAALLIRWSHCLSSPEGAKAAWVFYTEKVFVLAPALGTVLAYTLTEDAVARAAASLYLLTWMVSILPILVLKKRTNRRRPLASEARHIGKAAARAAKTKALSTITTMLRTGDANASFPSGDVGGAVCFAFSLWRCGGGGAGLAILCVLLSAFGRMYWQAHHALDVTFGALIALACCVSLDGVLSSLKSDTASCPAAAWWHPFAAMAALIVQQKLQPQHVAGLKGATTKLAHEE